MRKIIIAITIFMLIASYSGFTAGKNLPKGPAFKSAVYAPKDEGTVKPMKKSAKKIRIAVLGLENNPFWLPVKRGAQEAGEQLKAFNGQVDWIVPAGDKHTADVFGDAVDAAIAQQYDAIATIAGDSGIIPYIKRAVDAGIPVATFNVEVGELNPRLLFVGADLYKQGENAADALAKLIGGKGKVAVVTGFFAVEGHELRRNGFEETCKKKYPGITIVGRTETGDKDDAGFAQANDFMTANPDLAAFYSCAGGSIGIAKAIEENGKAGKVKFVCYDYVDDIMAYVEKGVVSATLGQNPYAQGHDPAIRLFNYLVAGQVPPAARLFTKSDVVTKVNVYDFWEGHKK